MVTISILTPTYNRNFFLCHVLSRLISLQTYDLKKVEWIIVDDSESENEPKDKTEFFKSHPLNQQLHTLRYIYLSKKLSIGHKRNICKNLALGEYLVHMDDDDFYSEKYLELIEYVFTHASEDVIGASKIAFVFPDSPHLVENIPLSMGPHQTCGGIMSYRSDYALQNNYNSYNKYAEEKEFLNGFFTPIFQIKDTMHYNLALCHSANTVDKKRVKVVELKSTWLDHVRDHEIILYYLSIYESHINYLLKVPKYKDYILQVLEKTIEQLEKQFSNI